MKKNKLQIDKDLEVEKFIYGITKEIWENKQINSIYDYYNEDVIVRSPRGSYNDIFIIVIINRINLFIFPNFFCNSINEFFNF